MKAQLLLAAVMAISGSAEAKELRAYVTNFEGEKISAINIATGRQIAEIQTGKNPHGVAIAPDGSEVFVTNEGDGTLSFIDPKENRVTASIHVGNHPQQPAIDSSGKRLYVPLNLDHAVAVIDLAERKVIATVPVGRNPHIILASPTSRKVYVTSEGDEKIAVLDTDSNQVTKDIPVWTWPRVPAISPDGKTLFQTIRWMNGALVVNLEQEKVVDRVALPEPPGFPKEGMVAHGLRLTPDGSELWLTTQFDGKITIIDPKSLKTKGSLRAGKNPNWIEFTPDGKIAVVSNTGSDDVSLFDAKKRKLLRRVAVVKAPKRLAVGFVDAVKETVNENLSLGGDTDR